MKKAGCWLLFGAQFLVITGFWFHFHRYGPQGNLFAGSIADRYLAWGRLAGLLAAAGVLFQLILVGRVKWVERLYGLDRLTRLHSLVGFLLVTCLAAHPVLVTAAHALYADATRYEQLVDFCRNWPDVLDAVIAACLMAVVIVTSAINLLTRVLRYEVWRAIHLSIYVAIALAFGHQVEVGGDLGGSRLFRWYWYALYVFAFGNLLYFRVWRPVFNFARHRFVVAAVKNETGDVSSVTIEGRRMDRFPAAAGQFLLVRFLAPGFRWETHPFSISRAPDGRQLRLTIKQLGDYTRRIPLLKPGTRVVIDGPHGVFTSARCRAPKVLMIAGGIGITPLRAVAEEMAAAGRDMVLLYANRNREAIVFREELDALAAASGGRLRVVHVLSGDAAWDGEKGYVDAALVSRLVPDYAGRDVYLCGPPPMMKLARKFLVKLGIPSSRIYYERFAL